MREILFRGKRIDNGKWVYGSLLKVTLYGETLYLIFGDNFSFDGTDVKAISHALVNHNTVGQYTGLADKSGKKIFEGDIIRDFIERIEGEKIIKRYHKTTAVTYSVDEVGSCGCCYPTFTGTGFVAIDALIDSCEIIGNIHDNPELLGGNSP